MSKLTLIQKKTLDHIPYDWTTAPEIAKKMGLHLDTLRSRLNVLRRKGLVRREARPDGYLDNWRKVKQ